MDRSYASFRRRIRHLRTLLGVYVSPQYLETIWPSYGANEITVGPPRIIPLQVHHEIPLVDVRRNRPYIKNTIRTSRYTIYDFVPKQLIFQATRLSNFYFIVIGVPQTIPGFSTTGNFTTILPLLVFMLLTILKEGYDDLRRHRLDARENSTLATRYAHRDQRRGWTTWMFRRAQQYNEDEAWHHVRWSSIRVGDILKVHRDEDLPADVVLLHADSDDGVAYIDTMALDGETNLKFRQPIAAIQRKSLEEMLVDDNIVVTVESPNRDLHSYNGKMVSRSGEVWPLTLQEIMYRGCTVRNTKSVIGLVVNTGEQCKIRMNANHHPRAKKPRLESHANHIVITLIVYVIFLSVGCSVGYLLFQQHTENISWYLNDAAVPFQQIIVGYGIMFNNVIPLALYISLEIVKIAQVLMISSDLDMYDEQNKSPMRCNTNTILENLGQVDFILSDKTGTLTQNVMSLKAISAGGNVWNHLPSTECAEALAVSQEVVPACADDSKPHFSTSVGQETSDDEKNVFDQELRSRTTAELVTNALNQPGPEIVLAMSVCNMCMPEKSMDLNVSWQSSSPDELAIVQAAGDLDFRLIERNTASLTIQNVEKQLKFDILNIIEFSSKRKRMSIILRCPDGRIWLVCKGADDMISSRLRSTESESTRPGAAKKCIEKEHRPQGSDFHLKVTSIHSNSTIECTRQEPSTSLITSTPGHTGDCFQHVDDFAVKGLRTLIFAHKYIDEEEYCSWKKRYDDASTSLRSRQESIELIAEEIEESFDLLGATAIEDRLQCDVPETIEKLQRANLRIWILTGDKRETAINIAHSARVCRPDSVIIIIDVLLSDLEQQLGDAAQKTRMHNSKSVVVIDGQTLSVIEASQKWTKAFFSMAPAMGSVICCRASPAQKAFVVKAIQQHVPKAVTLAVGDGANDIAMIQSAHVGIGISGREGMQAARVADYNIGQFSFLQKLLLVHGRWSYVRTAKFVLWTFWKEMFFYMMQALYQRYNGYSGSSLYENWSLTALNTLFTSLCVILPGIFEQDLRADTLLAVPELYVYGQLNHGLNLPSYLTWMAGATMDGLIVWYLPWKLYGDSSVMSDNGAFALGDMMFSLAICWTNWKLLIVETHLKTKIILIGFLVTVAGWWIWNIFLAGVYTDNISPFDVKDGLFQTFGKDPYWWLTFFVTLMVLALVDLCKKVLRGLLTESDCLPFGQICKKILIQGQTLKSWQELEREPGLVDRLRKSRTETSVNNI